MIRINLAKAAFICSLKSFYPTLRSESLLLGSPLSRVYKALQFPLQTLDTSERASLKV